MGSLHNIDFGVFWASWGGSGKEPGSGNRFQVSMGSERMWSEVAMGSDRFRRPEGGSKVCMGSDGFRVPKVRRPVKLVPGFDRLRGSCCPERNC